MFEKAHEQEIGVLLNGDRGNLGISWGSTLRILRYSFRKDKMGYNFINELDQYSKNVGGSLDCVTSNYCKNRISNY